VEEVREREEMPLSDQFYSPQEDDVNDGSACTVLRS
jgi:hypothetical protein